MTLLAKTYNMWLQPVVIELADLKKISIPVLVMARGRDFTSVEENAEIFLDLPNGQLIIVPASNHGTFNKRPELVNLAIREFLGNQAFSFDSSPGRSFNRFCLTCSPGRVTVEGVPDGHRRLSLSIRHEQGSFNVARYTSGLR